MRVFAVSRSGRARLLLALALVFGASLTCIWFGARIPDPHIEGRPLSAWLKDLEHPAYGGQHKEAQAARAALRQAPAGDVVPVLVAILKKQESERLRRGKAWISAVTKGKITFGPPIERLHWSAASALNLFGQSADAAIPALLELLRSPRDLDRTSAFHALRAMTHRSADVVGPMAEAIETSSPTVQENGWKSLAPHASNSESHLATMLRALGSTKPPAEPAAISTILSVPGGARATTHLISSWAKHPNEEVRGTLSFRLRFFTNNIAEAQNVLAILAEDPAMDIRRTAVRSSERLSVGAQLHPGSLSILNLVNSHARHLVEVYASLSKIEISPAEFLQVPSQPITFRTFGPVSKDELLEDIQQTLFAAARLELQIKDGRLRVLPAHFPDQK